MPSLGFFFSGARDSDTVSNGYRTSLPPRGYFLFADGAIDSDVVVVTPPTGQVGTDGGRWPVPKRRGTTRKRRAERLPEDYERERKLLERYLDELKEQRQAPGAATPGKTGDTAESGPALETTTPVAPRLTNAMARVAQAHELESIAADQHAAAADRTRAEEEHRRRRQAAVAAVLMMFH